MKLYLESLGCDKNLCDSEVMLGILAKHGMTFTDEISEAEIIVINTCSFIGDAQEESINSILSAAAYKQNNCKYLIATGCLAERFKEEFTKELPEVDGIIGITAFHRIAEVIERLEAGEQGPVTAFEDKDMLQPSGLDRILSTGGHYAYLKIAEGCNKRCTYCIIPHIRGNFRSRPLEELVNEATSLAEGGVKELILVAQETTLYGIDIYGKKTLPELLNRLSEIDGIRWIRLLYCYPEEVTQELIDVMSTNSKVLHYIDIPIQSGSDNVLRAMGRKTSRSEIIELIKRLRKAMPDIAIRSTLITGFPGETDEDYNNTLDFVSEARLDRLGVFKYSQEDGTPAALFPDQISNELIQLRFDELMSLQQELSYDISSAFIGKKIDAFVEGYIPEDEIYVARTYRDAPGVDGLVFVKSDRPLESGDIIPVVITGATEYDLTAEVIYEFT